MTWQLRYATLPGHSLLFGKHPSCIQYILWLNNDVINNDIFLGSSPQTEKFNLPRSCLRHFFAVRKCFVFPRPASTQNMRRMEELAEEDLDSEFLDQANTFCHYIYDNADPKTVSGGRTITGTGVCHLRKVLNLFWEPIINGLCIKRKRVRLNYRVVFPNSSGESRWGLRRGDPQREGSMSGERSRVSG